MGFLVAVLLWTVLCSVSQVAFCVNSSESREALSISCRDHFPHTRPESCPKTGCAYAVAAAHIVRPLPLKKACVGKAGLHSGDAIVCTTRGKVAGGAEVLHRLRKNSLSFPQPNVPLVSRHKQSLSQGELDLPIGAYADDDPTVSRPISPVGSGFTEIQARFMVQFLHSSLSNVRLAYDVLKCFEREKGVDYQARRFLLIEAAHLVKDTQSMLSAISSYRLSLGSFDEFRRGFCDNFRGAYRGEGGQKDERKVIDELRRYFGDHLTEPLELPHMLKSHCKVTGDHLSRRGNSASFDAFFRQKAAVLRQLSNDAADVFSSMTLARFVHALEQDNPEEAWAEGGDRQSEIIQTSDALCSMSKHLRDCFGRGMSKSFLVDRVLRRYLQEPLGRRRSVESIGGSSPRVLSERRLSEECSSTLPFQIILNRSEDSPEQLGRELHDCQLQLSQLVAGLSDVVGCFTKQLKCEDDRNVVNDVLRKPPHEFLNRHVSIDLCLKGDQPRTYALAFLPDAILEEQARKLRRDLARVLVLLKRTPLQEGRLKNFFFFFRDRPSKAKKEYDSLAKTMEQHCQFWGALQKGAHRTGILEFAQQSRTARLRELVHWGAGDSIDYYRKLLLEPLKLIDRAMPNALDERIMPKDAEQCMNRYLWRLIERLRGLYGSA